jgi:hypothetical protein
MTFLELPSGAIHAHGTLIAVSRAAPSPLADALRVPREIAVSLGRPVRVSVARADGSVQTLVVSSFGSAVELPWHRPRPVTGLDASSDPGAEFDPRDLADTATALEFQGLAALRSRSWAEASRLYQLAAVGLDHLGSPAEEVARVLEQAVQAWLRIPNPDATAGYALGHLLVRVAPSRGESIAAMLRRLDATLTG